MDNDRTLMQACILLADRYPHVTGNARHQLRRILQTAIGIGCIEGSPVESVELVTFDDFERYPDFDDLT